ncbi:hypothetical protein HOI83_00040 [Candidatus Uhrbacteria bacterium]|nr:hypothetical protein [Candidatus Uhrbacteria bacterium]
MSSNIRIENLSALQNSLFPTEEASGNESLMMLTHGDGQLTHVSVYGVELVAGNLFEVKATIPFTQNWNVLLHINRTTLEGVIVRSWRDRVRAVA